MPNQRGANSTTSTFTLPKHLLKWVQEQAQLRGQSTSEYLRHLLLNQWDKENQGKKEKK
jgi:Arc/MetJ-type ribon-helix-helix transcriptional regulator